jgi:multidrug efflux pump subunit AcrB
MTTLMTASIIAFGVFGFRLLPVSALPKVDFPTIAVTATLPGASADTMASSVAGPIERQLSTIAGISSMSSTSSEARSIYSQRNRRKRRAVECKTSHELGRNMLRVRRAAPVSKQQ